MNKQINPMIDIAGILANAPISTELYSPMFGNVKLLRVDHENIDVSIDGKNRGYASFNRYGKYVFAGFVSHEVMLFPSEDERTWNAYGNV